MAGLPDDCESSASYSTSGDTQSSIDLIGGRTKNAELEDEPCSKNCAPGDTYSITSSQSDLCISVTETSTPNDAACCSDTSSRKRSRRPRSAKWTSQLDESSERFMGTELRRTVEQANAIQRAAEKEYGASLAGILLKPSLQQITATDYLEWKKSKFYRSIFAPVAGCASETGTRKKRIVAIIGAGISTSCGICAFRSAGTVFQKLQTEYPLLMQHYDEQRMRAIRKSAKHTSKLINAPVHLTTEEISSLSTDAARSDGPDTSASTGGVSAAPSTATPQGAGYTPGPFTAQPDDSFLRYALSLTCLKQNPRLLYRVLGALNSSISNVTVQPSTTHYFLRFLAELGYLQCLVTQNIDNIEAMAGIPSHLSASAFFQAHGSVSDAGVCLSCSRRYNARMVNAAIDDDAVAVCGNCGVAVKPGIVCYEEDIQLDHRRCRDIFRTADTLLVVGTGLQVNPVNVLPGFLAPSADIVIMSQYFNIDNWLTDHDLRTAIYLSRCQVSPCRRAIVGDHGQLHLEPIQTDLITILDTYSCDYYTKQCLYSSTRILSEYEAMLAKVRSQAIDGDKAGSSDSLDRVSTLDVIKLYIAVPELVPPDAMLYSVTYSTEMIVSSSGGNLKNSNNSLGDLLVDTPSYTVYAMLCLLTVYQYEAIIAEVGNDNLLIVDYTELVSQRLFPPCSAGAHSVGTGGPESAPAINEVPSHRVLAVTINDEAVQVADETAEPSQLLVLDEKLYRENITRVVLLVDKKYQESIESECCLAQPCSDSKDSLCDETEDVIRAASSAFLNSKYLQGVSYNPIYCHWAAYMLCYNAFTLQKARLQYDESLDPWSRHFLSNQSRPYPITSVRFHMYYAVYPQFLSIMKRHSAAIQQKLHVAKKLITASELRAYLSDAPQP